MVSVYPELRIFPEKAGHAYMHVKLPEQNIMRGENFSEPSSTKVCHFTMPKLFIKKQNPVDFGMM